MNFGARVLVSSARGSDIVIDQSFYRRPTLSSLPERQNRNSSMRIGQSHRNAECLNGNGPSSGGEAGAILGETARGRPVTFSYQPTTSGSLPLISFAQF